MSTVLLVDDHPVARLAVRMLLENEGHEVIAETDNGLDAVRLAGSNPPDLIVLDIDIPALNGLDVIERLRMAGCEISILVLTSKSEPHYVTRCMNAGADGFVSKKNNLSEFTDAARAVLRGYGYYPRRSGVATTSPEMFDTRHEIKLIESLSNQEMKVLGYLSRGMSNIQIGKEMSISNKTVSTYKRRLADKIGVKNQFEMMVFARRHNLD
ncbi:response regulator [Winslowiella iniecta]|uniref:LuxR family transcriptional regulator n=1 Tax=Winslowiella iniecta TaxID=1560201 RepID=A0A0L7T5K9_9GAMM|nr:response regulator [Winslowiella iniecta]KOC90640.1 hypothetical protein NG42_07970 [Winslowiella iniecta]KOC93068.1 hypothetical protein NG43_11835 [Winslowiella iniecta]